MLRSVRDRSNKNSIARTYLAYVCESPKGRPNSLAPVTFHRGTDSAPRMRNTVGEFVEEHLRHVVVLIGAATVKSDHQPPLPRMVAHCANIARNYRRQMHASTPLSNEKTGAPREAMTNPDPTSREPYPTTRAFKANHASQGYLRIHADTGSIRLALL